MTLPGGWLLTTGGAQSLRAPTLAEIAEIGVERGLIERERRIATKTGDEVIVHRPVAGVRVIPARMVGKGGL